MADQHDGESPWVSVTSTTVTEARGDSSVSTVTFEASGTPEAVLAALGVAMRVPRTPFTTTGGAR